MFIGYLYDPSEMNEHYYYHAGCNIQAYIAYFAGIALPFAGFVGTLGASVSQEALHLGDLGWMISFVASFVVYYGLCVVWPTKNQRLVRERGLSWEQAANDEMVAAPRDAAVYMYDTQSRAATDFPGEEPGKMLS